MLSLMNDSKLTKELYNSQFAHFSEAQTAYLPLRAFREMVFREYRPQIEGSTILFAGCGDGRECLPAVAAGAKKVVGIDVSDVAVDHARKNCPELEFLVMDMETMSFESQSFDLIFSFFSVMYKESLEAVLKEFKRVTKKEGAIILAVPHPVRKMMKYNANNSYFVKGRQEAVWKGVKRFGYNRLFEDYIEAFRQAGLVLHRLMEPQPVKETLDTPDSEIAYPHFLLFELGSYLS